MSANTNNSYHLKTLILSAIGIVYGDIGTSPLYALKSCFLISNLALTKANLLGIISLIIWTLFLVVTIKYVYIVMRADNKGEGGILSLSFLCRNLNFNKYNLLPLILGIVGTSLFFADGIITPAISVLGALEGIEMIYPYMGPNLNYIAIVILTFLFLIQKKGSGVIGNFFGPIMVIWFVTIAVLGIIHIITQPMILKAFNPYYAVKFLIKNNWQGFAAIGGVVLVVTGAEALYADIGHFGRKAIKLSWIYFIFPCLVLNYLGQGALLITNPAALENPFYNLVSGVYLYPLTFLATLATIIASQSIITGIFSITWQAIMLNYLPKMQVVYTSSKNIGQVYVPVINKILYLLTVAAVLYFKNSDNMAHMYGMAVSAVMLITTVLIFFMAKNSWQWSWLKIALILLPMLFIDSSFVIINLSKLFEGAFYSIILSALVIYVIWVWISGSRFLEQYRNIGIDTSLVDYINNYEYITKIPGQAIYLCKDPDEVPDALLLHLHHNKFLHQKQFFIFIFTEATPTVQEEERYEVQIISEDNYQIKVKYGFREIPDFHHIIQKLSEYKIVNYEEDLSIILSRNIAVYSSYEGKNRLNKLNELIYSNLYNHSMATYDFYKIPSHKILELGIRHKFKISTKGKFLNNLS